MPLMRQNITLLEFKLLTHSRNVEYFIFGRIPNFLIRIMCDIELHMIWEGWEVLWLNFLCTVGQPGAESTKLLNTNCDFVQCYPLQILSGKDRLGGYHWSLVIRSWGSIVLVRRHIFAQFQNLAVEQSVTFAADNNSLSWRDKIVSSTVVSAKLHLTHKILLDGCLLKQVVDPCLLSWWCFLFFWWIALKEVKDMDNTLRQ